MPLLRRIQRLARKHEASHEVRRAGNVPKAEHAQIDWQPTYPFEKIRCWFDDLGQHAAQSVSAQAGPRVSDSVAMRPSLEDAGSLASRFVPLLSSDELEKARRFAFQELRDTYIVGPGLTRCLLFPQVKLKPQTPRLLD